MRKYFVISGFAAVIITASSAARAGTGEGSTSASSETSLARKVPTFTLDQAILTAMQRNPTLLNAEQEIKRTKGVIIQVRAQALPNISVNGTFEWTDPNLIGARILGGTGTTTGTTTTGATTTGATATGATTTGATATGATATGTTLSSSLIDSPPSQVSNVQPPADPSPTPTVRSTELSDIS